MTTFECLIILILALFVCTYIYFSISNRVLHVDERVIDDKRYEEQKNWEDQIKVLTTRLGEISTQNFNLGNTIKEWQTQYIVTKKALDEALEDAEKYKELAKEADAKYFDLKRDFEKLTTMERKD